MTEKTREVKFMRPMVTWTERTMAASASGERAEQTAECMLADKLANEARVIEEAVRQMLEVARSLRSEQETCLARIRWMIAEGGEEED